MIAIEPVPAYLECSRRNLKKEIDSGEVTIYPKGAWYKDDFLEMNVTSSFQASVSFVIRTEHDASIKLPLTIIDAMMHELDLERVDFIKMDIEGSERKPINDTSWTIQRFESRMSISMYHLQDDPKALPQIILSIPPDYRQECDSCVPEGIRIVPQVYFYF